MASSGEPSHDFYIMDVARVKTMWALALATFGAAAVYEVVLRCLKRRQARRPVLVG